MTDPEVAPPMVHPIPPVPSPEPPPVEHPPDVPGITPPPPESPPEPGSLAEASYIHAQFTGAKLSDPGNVLHDRPHFLRITTDEAGDQVQACGQDGEPWPCRAWLEMEQQGKVAHAELSPAPSSVPTGLLTLEQAARAAGVPVAELQRRLNP